MEYIKEKNIYDNPFKQKRNSTTNSLQTKNNPANPTSLIRFP